MGETLPQEYQSNELSLYRDLKWTEDASTHAYEDLKRVEREYFELAEGEEALFLTDRQRTEAMSILGRVTFEISYRRTAEMKEFEEQFNRTTAVDELKQAA